MYVQNQTNYCLLIGLLRPPTKTTMADTEWNITGKAYNCLAYLLVNKKIPDHLKASPVRDAHAYFLPWKNPKHTPKWRMNFTRMRTAAATSTLRWNPAVLTAEEMHDLDGGIDKIVLNYRPTAVPPAAARGGAGNEDDNADDVDIDDLDAAFGGTYFRYFYCFLLYELV